MVKSLNLVLLIRVPIQIDILGRFVHFQSFRATLTIPQLTCKFWYIYIILALREDLICHFSITYCLRYQGDRVLVRLFCTIYQSGMLVYILNEIATLWAISRVSHFGKRFEFCSVNLGSHSNRYIRKVSSIQIFRATFTIRQLTFKFWYILLIFAPREDLTRHFSIRYCLRYQGGRVLFKLFCIIYQSVMLVHILNEIATLWVISLDYG